MKTQRFIEQAKAVTVDVIRAYFIENDMEKVQSYFSQQHTSFVGTGRYEVFPSYDNIFHTMAIRIHEIQRSRLQNIQVYVTFANEARCLTLMKCHITTELYTGYSIELDLRLSCVLINEEDGAKILQLTCSAPNDMQSTAQPNTRHRSAVERLAAAAANRSPSGISYHHIDAEYSAKYVNQTLATLAGYATPQEMLLATGGRLRELVDERDQDKVRQVIGSLTEDGSTYNINYRLRNKQGGFTWVLERGRRTTSDDGEPCIICSASPLLPPHSATSSNMPPWQAPSYEIPTEAFLRISLDIVSSNTKDAAMQKLLQLACDLLQLAGIWVTDIHYSSQPMKLVTYYDTDGLPPPELFLQETGDEILSFLNAKGFAQCSDTSLLPAKYYPTFAQQNISSFCQEPIKVNGQYAYIATFYQKDSQHALTAHELEIIRLTSKVISILLNKDFFSKEHL